MNALVVDAWLQPHTYDTIHAYLEKTIENESAIRDLKI